MEPPRPSLSLKQYLKRYESGTEKKTKKTKKREKPRSSSSAGGLLVVDEDPVWQKPVQMDDDDGNESPDEKPQIDEDIEVKRMKRLEAIRSRRSYDSISEDGSGWVSISDTSNKLSGSAAAAAPDLSPPRQRHPRLDTPSPGREEGTAGAGDAADLSPPRQRRRHFDTPEPRDLSPARRLPEDLSPPRRGRLRGSEADAAEGSPMGDPSLSRRNLNGSTEDLSPPRRHRSKEVLGSRGAPDVDLSPPRKRREPSMAKPVRKAGLVSIEETREANARKKKAEDSMYNTMDPRLSGKGAKAVVRKEGKRVQEEDMAKIQEEKPKEIKLEWGKGLAQKREAEANAEELELEKDRPFARTRDDPELDKMLKERIRWGDPMAHLVKKKHSEGELEDLGDNEKMRESGFIVPQAIPSHSWIKRGLDFPPNRYGIRPGRHWDGVDRSTGYEKEMFKRQNEKRATEAEAYLWSVSDM